MKKGTPVLWYDVVARIPIQIGIPIELTVPEAKTALEEFLRFLAELAALPHADKLTMGEAYKHLSEQPDKAN